MTLRDSVTGLSAHVAQVLETRAEATVLLDIDAFCEVDWPPEDPRVYEALDGLHEFKNKIFFNMLTEETLRRFE